MQTAVHLRPKQLLLLLFNIFFDDFSVTDRNFLNEQKYELIRS